MYKEKNPDTTLTIFRPCTLYGKKVDEVLSKSYEKEKLYLFKGYDPERQLLHEDDAVEGFILALKKDSNGIYNLSPDGPFMTTQKIAALLKKDVIWLPSSPMVYGIFNLMWTMHLLDIPAGFVHFKKYRWILSNKKVKRDFGFKPKYSTEEALMSKYR
jgi:UDP-glucose 4-epimerase